jgi:hypothetical protein
MLDDGWGASKGDPTKNEKYINKYQDSLFHDLECIHTMLSSQSGLY